MPTVLPKLKTVGSLAAGLSIFLILGWLRVLTNFGGLCEEGTPERTWASAAVSLFGSAVCIVPTRQATANQSRTEAMPQEASESREQRVDAALLDIAHAGSGCAEGDAKTDASEETSANGFNYAHSAEIYTDASEKYATCSKVSDPALRFRFNLLATIALDMSAVRFKIGGLSEEADDAYSAAVASNQIARRDLAHASKRDAALFELTTELIASTPAQQ